MGWTVRLEDEHGTCVMEVLSTDDAALVRVLDDPDRYPRLNEIDPYGDTTFNTLQIPSVVRELDMLLDETAKLSEQQWLVDTRALAQRVQAGSHLYLKLLGD